MVSVVFSGCTPPLRADVCCVVVSRSVRKILVLDVSVRLCLWFRNIIACRPHSLEATAVKDFEFIFSHLVFFRNGLIRYFLEQKGAIAGFFLGYLSVLFLPCGLPELEFPTPLLYPDSASHGIIGRAGACFSP